MAKLKRFGIYAFGITMMHLDAKTSDAAITEYCKLKNVHEDNVGLLSAAEVEGQARMPGECRHRTLAFAKALQPGSPVWYEWTTDEKVGVTDKKDWDRIETAERNAMDHAAKRSGDIVLVGVGKPKSDPNCSRCQFVEFVRTEEAKKEASDYYRCTIEVVTKDRLRSMAIGPDRQIAEAGETLVILAIYCANGLYSYWGQHSGRHCVPRSWLVEAGALEPIPEQGTV